MDTNITTCINCKHLGRGVGVDERERRPGRIPPGPFAAMRGGDMICLRHPRGREPIDPVTGYGGQSRALYCKDVNKGDCPDYQPGLNEGNTDKAILAVALLLSVGFVVLALALRVFG